MSQGIDQVASRWAVRLDAGDLLDPEKVDLETWLAADTRHRGALLRARAGLALLDGERSTPAAVESIPHRNLPGVAGAHPGRGNRAWRWGAALATACAASLAVWIAVPHDMHVDTQPGEIRRIALEDGSIALLNARSDIAVDYEKASRQIRVARGEAWFQVAHNAARPFVVSADTIRVRATGTAFAVRRDDNGQVRVVVTEGTVEVWRDGENARLKLRAGDQTTLAAREAPKPSEIRAVGTTHPLAWRDGGLELTGMSVGDAVKNFNQYNQRQISIGDPYIADTKMVGYFKLDNPEQFADAVARVTNAGVYRSGNEIVIEMK